MALTLVTSDLIHGLDYSKLTGTITTWNQNTTGNADTATLADEATILANTRNINGVPFNGSTNITIADATKLPLAGGTLTGTLGGTSATFSGAISASNLSGTNTGNQTTISGNAGTVTNGVYTVGNQTIAGAKTFSSNVLIASGEYLSWGTIGATSIEGSTASNKIQFRTGSGNRMIINNTGVGIGTTSPYEKLTIDGGNIILGGASDNYSSTRGIYFRSNFSPNGAYNSTNQTRNISIVANTNKLELNSYEGIDFYTSVIRRMTILTNGDVGIGADNPTNKLVVRGLSSDGTGGANNVAQFEGPSGTNGCQVFVDDTNSNTGIQCKNGYALLINPHGGNVGIGTDSPTDYGGTSNTLELRGVSGNGAGVFRVSNGENSVGAAFFSGTSASTLGTQTSHSLNLMTNNLTKLTILSGGRVGINETNAQAKLHVTETASNAYGEIRIEGQNRGGKLQMYNAAYPVSSINTDQSGNIDFQTSGAFASTTLSTKLSISSGGNVGIGVGAGASDRLSVKSVGSGSSTFNTVLTNSSNAALLTVRSDGAVAFVKINDFTTSNSPNTWINTADGKIYINTSSIRYKKNINNYEKGLSELMQLRTVSYEGKSDVDKGKVFAGFIAEEVHELGLTEYVGYDDELKPNSVGYAHLVVLLTKSIQEQQAQIELLKQEVELLKQ